MVVLVGTISFIVGVLLGRILEQGSHKETDNSSRAEEDSGY